MEFQCLHGMGHNLYDHIVGADNVDISCRIYALLVTIENYYHTWYDAY